MVATHCAAVEMQTPGRVDGQSELLGILLSDVNGTFDIAGARGRMGRGLPQDASASGRLSSEPGLRGRTPTPR